jgi:hypothetical protein
MVDYDSHCRSTLTFPFFHFRSGKTTQVPQFILDDLINNGVGAKANMLVTQPRRISAIGVAERVAQERCESCGETGTRVLSSFASVSVEHPDHNSHLFIVFDTFQLGTP